MLESCALLWSTPTMSHLIRLIGANPLRYSPLSRIHSTTWVQPVASLALASYLRKCGVCTLVRIRECLAETLSQVCKLTIPEESYCKLPYFKLSGQRKLTVSTLDINTGELR
jgi:hypothetical protein